MDVIRNPLFSILVMIILFSGRAIPKKPLPAVERILGL
jgi:hypothetical protein